MIEEIRQYFYYIRKQRQEYHSSFILNSFLYWRAVVLFLVYCFLGILLGLYGNFYGFIFLIIASLFNALYLKTYNNFKLSGDILVFIDFIVFFLGTSISNGIYSPLMPVLFLIPLSANYLGYYIKSVEAIVIDFILLILLFFGSFYGVFSQKITNVIELEFIFYGVVIVVLGLYIVINSYNRQVTDKKQRKLDQLKSEWVSIVSHELRTPLTAIRGAMGLVHSGLAGELSPQAKELIKIANNNCERLTRLVNDILDIEKMEQGLVSLNLKPSDINFIIQEAVSTYRAQANENQIELVLQLEPSSMIFADRDRVTQVVQNLLSNALKFSPKQSKILIQTQKKASRVRVEVIDFGTGIPKEFQPQIFQKFTQADSSASRHAQGSGLGLAICRSLIALHDGTIGFEPNNSNGAVFWFELPLYQI
jgi:signal transduction histidine kinase